MLALVLMMAALAGGCAMPLGEAASKKAQVAADPGPGVSSGRNGSQTDVLIWEPPSYWEAEAHQLARITKAHRATYREVSSKELDAMSLDELATYSLLLVPGGDGPTFTASLSKETHARLRAAVQQRGMDYLGFCAGAWIAIAPAPTTSDDDVKYGIGVADGPLQEYNYLSKQGLPYAMSQAIFPGGRRQELLWYGGPITPEQPGAVVARYEDGTAAISQLTSGLGWVIVSGLHPAITKYVLDALDLSQPEYQEAIAPDFAWSLIDSGIHHTRLSAF